MMKRWNEMSEKNREYARVFGLLLLLLPFFEPGYVSLCLPTARIFYNAGQVVSTLIAFGWFVYSFVKERYLSKAAIALIVMEGWMSVNVLMHQGLDKAAFLGIISALVVCMLIELSARRHAHSLLQAFLLLYELLIGLNLVSMLLFPDGLYYTSAEQWDNWLLGYRNMFLFFFAPAIALELLNKHRTGKPARFYVVLAICTVSMVMSTSKTGLLGILTFIALYVTGIYLKKFCNIVTITIAGLAANVAIVVLKLQTLLQPVFTLLNREVTFTGRTTIWERTLQMIYEKPMLGYGLQPADVRGEATGLWSGVKAHNFFLEQQYCFGLIGTALLICFMGVSVYVLYKNRKHPFAAALSLGMAVFHLLMLMESHINNIPMYSFFFLTCFADAMIAQQTEGVKRG